MALYRAYKLGFIIMVKLNHKQGLVSRKGKITRNLGRITKNTAKNTNKNKTRQGQIKKKNVIGMCMIYSFTLKLFPISYINCVYNLDLIHIILDVIINEFLYANKAIGSKRY